MSEVLLFAQLPTELRESIERGQGRCLCPRCDGGTSREFSLDVRQDQVGVLKLKCYRASCGWFAISVTDPNAKLQARAIKPPSVYRDPTEPLDVAMQYKLLEEYGCHPQVANEHGWRQSRNGALVMSIRDPFGNERGKITRTFDTPKRCYTFKATAQPWLDHWPAGEAKPDAHEGITTVIVEDCISALRLSCLGYNAVALLGTSLTVDQAREIQAHYGGGRIFLALDRDAFEKSLHMAKRHQHVVKLMPVCLDEDIKNMQFDQDITNYFGENRWVRN